MGDKGSLWIFIILFLRHFIKIECMYVNVDGHWILGRGGVGHVGHWELWGMLVGVMGVGFILWGKWERMGWVIES